jgi:hypothetical protein
MAVSSGKVPFYSIINNNYVGGPPKCLVELTEPELAFLTLTKSYGYCFSYIGGEQKNLNNSFSIAFEQES